MKKFAIGAAIAASLVSTAAMAADQRPSYLAFSAPAATPAVSAPVAPRVKKKNGIFEGVPVVVPIVGAVTILGFIAAVTTGGNGSPG